MPEFPPQSASSIPSSVPPSPPTSPQGAHVFHPDALHSFLPVYLKTPIEEVKPRSANSTPVEALLKAQSTVPGASVTSQSTQGTQSDEPIETEAQIVARLQALFSGEKRLPDSFLNSTRGVALLYQRFLHSDFKDSVREFLDATLVSALSLPIDPDEMEEVMEEPSKPQVFVPRNPIKSILQERDLSTGQVVEAKTEKRAKAPLFADYEQTQEKLRREAEAEARKNGYPPRVLDDLLEGVDPSYQYVKQAAPLTSRASAESVELDLLDAEPSFERLVLSRFAGKASTTEAKVPALPIEALFLLYSFWAVCKASYKVGEKHSMTHQIARIPLIRPLGVFARVVTECLAERTEEFNKQLALLKTRLDSSSAALLASGQSLPEELARLHSPNLPSTVSLMNLCVPKALEKQTTRQKRGLYLVGACVSYAKLIDSCFPKTGEFHIEDLNTWREQPPSLVGALQIVMGYVSHHLERTGIKKDDPETGSKYAEHYLQYLTACGVEVPLPLALRTGVEIVDAFHGHFATLEERVERRTVRRQFIGQPKTPPLDPLRINRDLHQVPTELLPFWLQGSYSFASLSALAKNWARVPYVFGIIDPAKTYELVRDADRSLALREILRSAPHTIPEEKLEAVNALAATTTNLIQIFEIHEGLMASVILPYKLEANAPIREAIWASYKRALGEITTRSLREHGDVLEQEQPSLTTEMVSEGLTD